MKVLIVDDEPLARERLRGMLGELPGVEVLGDAGNGREAVELAAALQPDTVLMDIAMPVMDGLEAARHLAGFEPPPAVVFCTAYDEHALAAFEAAAIDYLVKPVRRERLQTALEKARRFGASHADRVAGDAVRTHLCARLRGSLRLIPVDEIHYLQAEEKYVVVHHTRGQDLIEESLKSLEEEFGERFLRIHRNCLVARNELMELRRTGDGHVQAILRHAERPLEVSRRCVPGLRERLKHL
ncbi:LytR/AlgR family response regulator transcription factor [Rehaibacterium terrae]|jgi:two-component system response regulator AlgR|uniref:Two-component system response regulator AlgR n=1 Tax=Rehaibacterium terrae TaxID=1341696 RepID=A0A7W8DDY2_9GAMM|nr:LytTR family DNA-binding domain-containing protein [Rehaibacterium terrae]MBB5015406.1 two-component system response regulator AlgR [Rehaibacterium terrae]